MATSHLPQLPIAPHPKKIVDNSSLKLEPSSFPMMHRYYDALWNYQI